MNTKQQLQNVKIYDRSMPYQSIDGISGIRNTNSRLKLMNFPDDLENESVLDLGCNTGVFCVEAKKRNAGRVMGVDYSIRSIF